MPVAPPTHVIQASPASGSATSSAISPARAGSIGAAREGAGGVLLIAIFKLSKAIFFTLLGVAALHMVHRNLGDYVLRLTDALPVDPEGRLVSFMLDKADLIGSRQLRHFGIAFFAYAVVCLVEGTGLFLQKAWAEYFTVILTALALPWETYELLHQFTIPRVGLLLLNLAVLLFLLWVLKRKRRNIEAQGSLAPVPLR